MNVHPRSLDLIHRAIQRAQAMKKKLSSPKSKRISLQNLRGEKLNYKMVQNGCYGRLLTIISWAP